MSEHSFSIDNSSPVNPHSQRLAHIRQQVLPLFLNDSQFVETILGTADEHARLSDDELHSKSKLVKNLLTDLHAADLADMLEALPYDERLALWHLIDNHQRGEVLVEASVSVWDSLIKDMSDKELLRAVATLHVDEQAYIAEHQIGRAHV